MFDWLRSVLPYMHAMATFGGRNSGLFPGRHLFLLDGATVGPKRFFKRHGAKAVFIARFIALFPPVVANLLAAAGQSGSGAKREVLCELFLLPASAQVEGRLAVPPQTRTLCLDKCRHPPPCTLTQRTFAQRVRQ